uniref:CYP79A206 n=1 Tax=Miconia microphysca TaxID=3021300 RepID=A0AA50KI25_9MYRT|nr:CYP79A206 [Miconia microphysca]
MNISASAAILPNTSSLNATTVFTTIPSFLAASPLSAFNAFLVSTFVLLYAILKSQQSSQKSSKQLGRLPPGPTPWPVLGNLPEMLSNKPVFRWMHRLMEEMNTEIACVRLGSTHVISVTCPKIAAEILKKQDAVFASRPESMAARSFSDGYKTAVLVPHGDQWKKMRRVLTSEIICPARHKWLHDKRVYEADNLVRYVLAQCGVSHDVNLRTAARHYSGNLIRNLMFSKRHFGKGMPDGGPGIEEEEHVEALFTALGYLYAFCVSDYFPCLEGLDLDGHEKIVKEATMTLKKYHDPIIDQRIQQWRKSGDSNNKEPQDLLDVLIALKDSNGQPSLTSDEIKAQTTEIMMAAIDNPSNVAEWAMAEMINQPELLQKAVEELDRVVGKDRLVQESDIPHLNYIKACARETFRLHPIAPFNVPHVAMSDTTVAGYFIPKGSHMLVSRLGLGRNPKVWDEPLEFRPERHLGDGYTNVVLTEPDLRFISFSTGRRGCIAASLGTTMTVMLLARLIQGFSWEKSPQAPGIDLSESEHDLFLVRPLNVHAEPRLPVHLYPSF